MRRLHAPILVLALIGSLAAPSVDAGGRTAKGTASGYCRPGVSICTRGFPAAGLYAAAGPALRVGAWRGRLVTVCHRTLCARARLVDWCACPGRLVDLYGSVFGRLAPLSRGLIRVEVSW